MMGVQHRATTVDDAVGFQRGEDRTTAAQPHFGPVTGRDRAIAVAQAREQQ
jgi:hypothetical protein